MSSPVSFRAALAVILAATATLGLRCVPAELSQPTDTPVYGYRIVGTYPHDREAFTQGLVYRDGFLYESTGLHGRSTLRQVRLETGEVIRQYALEPSHFGEGLTDWGSALVQLTWQTKVGFVYSLETFAIRRTFSYTGEGWGLTQDGTRLIMSDGSSTLRFVEPVAFQETARLPVTDGGTPVGNLNELEFVRGEIYANVWQTDRIARISPRSGHVTGWIDLRGLLRNAAKTLPVDVLNGIAYDAARDRLFVTGKLWPMLFEIALSDPR